MQVTDLPIAGIAVTVVLLGSGFVAYHLQREADEERSDWLRRKLLGGSLMVAGAVSLVLTIASTFE